MTQPTKVEYQELVARARLLAAPLGTLHDPEMIRIAAPASVQYAKEPPPITVPIPCDFAFLDDPIYFIWESAREVRDALEKGVHQWARFAAYLIDAAQAYETTDHDAADAITTGGPAPAPAGLNVSDGKRSNSYDPKLPPRRSPDLHDYILPREKVTVLRYQSSRAEGGAVWTFDWARNRAVYEQFELAWINYMKDLNTARTTRFEKFVDWQGPAADSVT